MKKILFILPSLGVGGLEKVQVSLANQLVQHSYDVTVKILSPVDDLKDALDARVHLVYKHSKQHFGNKIPFIRHRFYDDGMWETRASARRLYQYYVVGENYDVEIAFFRGMPIKIIGGSTNHKAKHIAWVHSDFKQASGYNNNFKSIMHVYEAYKSMDHVICVSNKARDGFIEVVGDTGNLITIYNLISVDEIRKKADLKPEIKVHKGGLHLVLVGRLLDRVKGQKRMIMAVTRLHNEGRDVSLTLVGGGQDEQVLGELIRKHHAEAYIIMTGSQMNPYPYIKESNLLVCASYYEGYNLTVAEALALGVPVLSTDCTGPNEILDNGKYGMIVENSEEGLYNGLRQFAENLDLLNEYKEKAMQRQDFFDEDRILKQITDLF